MEKKNNNIIAFVSGTLTNPVKLMVFTGTEIINILTTFFNMRMISCKNCSFFVSLQEVVFRCCISFPDHKVRL